MMCQYLDLDSASDWLKQISLAARPIRKYYQADLGSDKSSTWKIYAQTESFLRCHMLGESMVALQNVGHFLRL